MSGGERLQRHEFLRRVHGILSPRTYLEIGVNDGASLTLSRVPSIAIDPAFKVTKEISCDVQLARATSDDFFAAEKPTAHFGELPIDFAFIDGMHLFEFALRDFINVEKHSTWSTVVVFDDMLPRDVPEAARDRHTKYWAGDVYKLIPVLHRYRPDLKVIPLDTHPTGLLLVLGLDPTSTTLQDNYDEIIKDFVLADPQQPILSSSVWKVLSERAPGSGAGLEQIAHKVAAAYKPESTATLADWKPDPNVARPAPWRKEIRKRLGRLRTGVR